MDYVTLATQQLGGVSAAFLTGALVRRVRLEVLGSLIVGLVGGALGGLVLTQYAGPSPVLIPNGAVESPGVLALQIASGAVGGALLAIVTGLIVKCRRTR